MLRCFFHFFWILRGRKPPCCVVQLVSVGRGGALHVSCILFEISCIRWSSFVHVVCHWLLSSWSVSSVFVSSSICIMFSL